MKKVLVSLLLVVCIASAASAQDRYPLYRGGDNLLSVGVGFLSNIGNDYRATVPPLLLSYEYVVADLGQFGSLGIGGIMTVSNSKKEDSEKKKGSFNIGARATYHFAFAYNWEAYGGLFAGYKNEFERLADKSHANDDQFGYDVFLGARYRLNDWLGAFAETGVGISFLKIGVTFNWGK